MLVAEVILVVFLIYFICGLVIGVPFILKGVDQLDPAAHGASLGFRLMILPGTVALWPYLAARWVRAVRQEGGQQ